MVSWEPKEKYCQYPTTAITQNHRLGDLNNRSFFSQFWKLDVQVQGVGRVVSF